MANSRSLRAENQPSRLLNDAENQKLFELIGYRCVSLSSAVVQVFWAEGPSYDRWSKRWCGAAAFVKDNGKRSYYIRVFDLKHEKLLWEQELYSDFLYKDPRPYFHTFESDECPAGLNFANEDEARSFRHAVRDKIQIRHQRRRENTKKRAPSTTAATPGNVSGLSGSGSVHSGTVQPMHTQTTVAPMQMNVIPSNVGPSTGTVSKKSKVKKGKKPPLTKNDIGAPTNFMHISHVGWNADTGFDLESNPELRDLFQEAGITEEGLKKDQDMSKFVMEFLDQRGGLDAVKRDRERERARPPPPSIPSLPPSQPPPVPAVAPPTHSSRPPPPAVRPPVPVSGGRPPPLPGRPQGRSAPLPPPPPPNPPPSSRGLPPLPPPVAPPAVPPPVPSAAPPPPPPPGPPPPPAAPTKVEIPSPGSHPLPVAEPTDGRGALLKDIQKGTQLKPVTEDRSSTAKCTSGEEEGLAGALAKALAARAGALKGNDSDSDESSEDDEEWED